MSLIGKSHYDEKRVMENYQKKEAISILGVFLSGITAGIWGVTGIFGFLLLIGGSLFTGMLLLSMGCKGNLDVYFPGHKKQFFVFSKMLDGALTFLLGWTLAYDAIYLF